MSGLKGEETKGVWDLVKLLIWEFGGRGKND